MSEIVEAWVARLNDEVAAAGWVVGRNLQPPYGWLLTEQDNVLMHGSLEQIEGWLGSRGPTGQCRGR
ncbi:hypothetical protein [Nocardia salmonicida]|uniref:hypothetical protein n=1 Tax=Nocardia salmonicida TaxID=53431 RepID=UPI0034447DC8